MFADIITVLGPAAVVAFGALVALASEPFLADRDKHGVLPWIGGIACLIAALVQVAVMPAGGIETLGAMFAIDHMRGWLSLAILACTLGGLAGVQGGLRRDQHPGGEGYALMLLAASGALVMVVATDLIALFVGLELMSISIYGLVGLRRDQSASNEALFKYLIMGAVFSSIFLYGVALHYGATGTTAYAAEILDERQSLHAIGMALMVIGLLFKVGAVPFHFWSPDAYTGAPVGVTGFMAGVVKIGGFTALGALWLSRLQLGDPIALDGTTIVEQATAARLNRLQHVIAMLAVLSLLVGNFSALGQTSLRRLMAFSSVSHAGYMLLALLLPTLDSGLSLNSLWFYLVAYAVASAGLLAGLAAMTGRNDGDDFAQLAGAARRHPVLGVVLTVLVASLAGLPPTAGFLGKYLVLSELVVKGQVQLALIAMLMAAVGVVYYLRLVVVLWSERGELVPERGPGFLTWVTVVLAAVVTCALLVGPPDATGALQVVAHQP